MEFHGVIDSKILLFTATSLIMVSSIGNVFAQPLDDATATVLEFDGASASIELKWSDNNLVEQYEIGCVSCIPNVIRYTENNEFTINGVTAFPNSSNAMLYIISYDSNDEIINAKQILVDIKQ